MTSLRFISIPGSVLSRTDLQAVDRLVYGLLRFHQHKNGECWPSLAYLAACVGCDARTVRAAVRRLVKAGLVEILDIEGRTAYRVQLVQDDRYLRVTDAVLRMPDLSALEKLVLAMIGFNTQGNEDRHAWAKQGTMAEWLGCSRRSIIRAVDGLKDAGLIEARRRGPRSNQYTLTPQGEAAIVAHQGRKRCDNFAPPHREAENESSKELKRTAAVQVIPSAGLSPSCRPVEGTATPEERAVRRLVEHGVHPVVAGAIAFEQHHPPESIEQAIDNAVLRRAQHRAAGLDGLKPFDLAAYIVGSLNGARREAHTIKPSVLFAQAKARHEQSRRAAWTPLPETEFEQRRRRCIEGLRKAAS